MSERITREQRNKAMGLVMQLSEHAGNVCNQLMPLYDAGLIELGATDIADRIHGLTIQLSDLVCHQLRKGRYG